MVCWVGVEGSSVLRFVVGSVAAFRNADFYENDCLNSAIGIKPIKNKGYLIIHLMYYTNFILKAKGIENSGGIF